jgi:hypothetical protein
MKRMLMLVSVLAFSLAASGVLLGQDAPLQDNPFVGIWKLSLAKSKFTGMPAPTSETRRVVAEVGGGETVGYKGIAADGGPIAYSFATNLDGKDVPISGTGPLGADTIADKRVNANTHISIAKKAGKPILTTRAVVSKDGKVTTNTATGTNAQGQPVSITTVWEKQDPGSF